MNFSIVPIAILSALGLGAGVILTLAARFMSVKTDERVGKLREALPGANCGACGYAGCDEYAAKVASGEAKPNLCTPGGKKTAATLGEILGMAVEVEDKRAVVRCSGNESTSEYVMDYKGPNSCQACNTFYQGRKSCSKGCLGYGDCLDVCKFGAIKVENGVAVIDPERCTGCGVCITKCPNNLITTVPKSSRVAVTCASTDKGAYTRKVCKVGCIGCTKCQKVCECDAVTISDNLASIDPNKCTGCGKCAEACPSKCIQMV